MPARAATRAAKAEQDAAPVRTTRSTRTTAKAKQAETQASPESGIEGMTNQMKRVLKVSEPEPQAATSTKSRTTAKAPKANGVVKVDSTTAKSAGPSASSTAQSKAPSRTRPAVRPVAAANQATLATSSSSKPSEAVAPTVRRPANTSHRGTVSTGDTSRKTASARESASDAGPSTASRATSSMRTAPMSVQAKRLPSTTAPKASSSSSSKAEKPALTAATPTSVNTARRAIRPTVSLKGKEKEQVVQDVSTEVHPWSDPTSTMSDSERAQKAMTAVKTSLASLSLAMKAGVTYGTDEDDWTTERVDGEMAICDVALRTLRQLDEAGKLGDKGIEVEKAGQAVIARAMSLGMFRRAFDQLALARQGLSRMYRAPTVNLPDAPVPPSSLESHRLPKAWLSSCWLPVPEGDDMPVGLAHPCLQQLVGAWSCLIGIEGYGYDLPPFAKLIPDAGSTPSGWLNPLRMAMKAPLNTTSPVLSFFTRRLSAIPLAAPYWPHIYLVIAQALLLTASVSTLTPAASGPAPRAPSVIWDTINKWVLAYIERGDASADRHHIACRLLSGISSWADEVIEARGEERKEWFKGESWTKLLNLWIDLARKSRDGQALDQALALSTMSLDLGVAQKIQSSSPFQQTDQAEVQVEKANQAIARATTVFAQLGEVEIAATATGKVGSSATIDALRQTDWQAYGPCIAGLPKNKEGEDTFARAYRSTERARRLVAEILRKGRGADAELFDASLKWTFSASKAISFAVTHTSLTDNPIYDSLVSACVNAISYPLWYRSNAAEASDILGPLDLGRRIGSLGQTPRTRAECLKSLVDAAYNVAHGLHGHQRYELAIDVLQRAIGLSQLALDDSRNIESMETSQAWNDFLARRHAKYDLLGSCLACIERKEDAIRMGAISLTTHDPTIYARFTSTLPSAKFGAVFKENPRVDNAISRLATWLTNDLEPLADGVTQSRIDSIFRLFDEKAEITAEVRLQFGERLLQVMAQRAYKRDGLETAYILGQRLLGLLHEDIGALRRIRIIASLMLLTSSHGLRQEGFDGLVEQGNASLQALRSDKSDNETLVTEYQAVILVVRALNAYQVSPEPVKDVLSLSEEATHELRQLLVPPTRSRESTNETKGAAPSKSLRGLGRKPTASSAITGQKTSRSASETLKSTKSSTNLSSGMGKQRRSSVIPITEFDDVSRLASLLTSLVSLLGLLGHTLAKVNALKVLRALLRHREEFVSDYVSLSGELATQYSKLGKYSRASVVFAQAMRTANDHPKLVSPAVQAEVHLRHSDHLASLGQVEQARVAYLEAEELHSSSEIRPSPIFRQRVLDKSASTARISLAHRALASICLAQDDAAGAIRHLRVVMGLRSRIVNGMALLALDRPEGSSTPASSSAATKDEKNSAESNPFVVPDLPPDQTGANEPSRDTVAARKPVDSPLDNKFLHGLQWASAEHVVEAYIDLASAYAQRGSPVDAKYYLHQAESTAKSVRSPAMQARAATRFAVLESRLKQLEKAQAKIDEATTGLENLGGPDAFDLETAKGQVLARQELADQAAEILLAANNGIHDLDTVFVAADALLPSPRKDAVKKISLSASSARSAKEPLLPSTLSQVLRQQAWLLREAGQTKQSDELYRQLSSLQTSSEMKAEELYLNGRIALEDAFSHFKTDLFMSSLAESTIAMPMGNPGGQVDHRQSARHRIQITLDQANEAYRSALSLVAGSGRVEDVRQACLSLALLRAFQTSLGQGDTRITSFAADLLATSTSVTMHRELLEAVDYKFYDNKVDDMAWPKLDASASGSTTEPARPDDNESEPTSDHLLQEHWNNVRSRYHRSEHLSPNKSAYDLSVLPRTWAVLSISVTEDRNTMFISRHQNGHDPLVFCLPLDRQGKREGENDLFTFDTGMTELREIIEESDACSRSAKGLTTDEQKTQWWTTKRTLDKRLKELIDNVEYCWLGAFKTIFNPRLALTAERLSVFRTKIERVFNLALFGSAHETKRTGKVHLNDSLLECFATLSSSSREEEIEDFIYFILDIYQFHGVPVAIAELDLDQIGVDIVTVLTEMEATSRPSEATPQGPEHILLALDKNAQPFPWESMPCLRGRPISRIPSLPVLLDQVALGKILQPGNDRRVVNSKKTYYILNPSGDLSVTQSTFEPMLKEMQEHSGWKGIIGEKPSELEMSRVLRDYDLVLYFGHGGGEQYIRASKIRTLPKCATTFLWGCSSGKLEDQGHLDAAGTAWNYMMAGCPALTATLWDVTDRDIDRLTNAVYNRLGLNPTQIMEQIKPRAEHSAPGLLPPSGQGLGISTVEAVNQSRGDCKMTYLTGAAVVHYGIPVYIY